MTLGFDEDLPQNVYEFNEMRKKLHYEKTGIASLLKPAPVVQHLPAFDLKGNATFEAYKAAGKLAGKFVLITGKVLRQISDDDGFSTANIDNMYRR